MALTLTDVTEDTGQTELSTGRSRWRDAEQQKVDSDVAALLAGWNAQNKPAPAQSPAHAYKVPKAQKSDLKDLIRKAGRFHKTAIVFYKDKANEDGTVYVKFTVAALPPKADGNGQTETPPASAPAPAPEPAPEPQRRGVLGGRR